MCQIKKSIKIDHLPTLLPYYCRMRVTNLLINYSLQIHERVKSPSSDNKKFRLYNTPSKFKESDYE